MTRSPPACTLGDGTSVFSLAIDGDGSLLIGTGGEKGRVLKLEKDSDKPRELFSGEGVQYVWCLLRTPDGKIYAGTGPDGGLYEIREDGGYDLILDTDENNLLSMTSDGGDLLYVGTDPNGLVYRVNRKTRDVYVMLDAQEAEISALVLDKEGNLYAATSEALPQAPEGEPTGTTDETGRPESASTGAPIVAPSQPEPTPPKLPDPNPGEPNPIPKKLLILPVKPATRGHSTSSRSARTIVTPLDDQNGAGPATNPAITPHIAAPPPRPPSGEAGQAAAGATRRRQIDKEAALVTEIFRQPVLVMSLVEQDGKLLAGTGSDGLIYQIDPKAQEQIVLAKVEPKQVMCLLPSKGRISPRPS